VILLRVQKSTKKEIEILQDRIMFLHDMTCCKCRIEGREPLHIHHIDGNPSNNSENNLAVLCALCHHSAHVKSGLPNRALKPSIVTMYRNNWLAIVAERLKFNISDAHDKKDTDASNDISEDDNNGIYDYVHYSVEAMNDILPIMQRITKNVNQYETIISTHTPKILAAGKNHNLLRVVANSLGKSISTINPDMEKNISDFIEKGDTALFSQLNFVRIIASKKLLGFPREEYCVAINGLRKTLADSIDINRKVKSNVDSFIGFEQQLNKASSKLNSILANYDEALKKYINILRETTSLMN